MHVLVMGGGVVGVTCAAVLLDDGHQVTLIERHDGVGEESSFSNAALIAPGHAFAWASPRAPGMLLRSLYRNDQALRFRPSLDPELWRWSAKFLRQCTAARARINTLNKHRLCAYSQRLFQALTERSGIAYDGARKGLLYLYRSEASFADGVARTRILSDAGQDLQVLDPDAAARIEPALAPVKDQIAGALYGPTDESGDSYLFTRALADDCARRGARLLFQTTIAGIAADGNEIAGVETDRGRLRADAYVLALGCGSARFARPIGVNLPIYPIKGYSVTLPVGPDHLAPQGGGMDEDNLVGYARLGDRLRITATAEFAGYDTSHKPKDFRTMLTAAKTLFPRGGNYARPSYWACLRPMTPEGAPILGLGRHRNLYYNCGHGHMGWTMACGTARIVADLMAGKTSEIALTGLTLR
jgi:D-amino-acid dehydrogenase